MNRDVDFDENCDPKNPKKVEYDDIVAASKRIEGAVLKTPCAYSHLSSIDGGFEVYLKCEFLQYTGSFKERGARNSLLNLDAEARKRGVVAASLGNHSQGMSYHGMLLGIPTTVVMPVVAPLMKIQKCRSFGANVVIHGNNMTDAKHHALVIAKEKGLTFINGYDHPDIIAGQGTIGLEILEQVPDVEAIIIPVGGGGLISGITVAVKHLKPDVLVYGVETDKCASMAAALLKGEPIPFEITSTLADGLAVGLVGPNSFYNLKPLINKMVVVSEDWASRAILSIVELEKYIVEGAGACSVAAVLSGLVPELEGKKTVCVLSGGNIDTSVLSVCLDRGLVAEHRLVKFKVNIPTSPGSLAALCGLLSSIGISIKELYQERAWLQGSIFIVRVKVICETRGIEHVNELRDLLAKNYDACYFQKEHAGAVTDTQCIVSQKPRYIPYPQSATQSDPLSGPQSATQSGPQPAAQPGPQPAAQPGPQPGPQPAAQPGPEPATPPASPSSPSREPDTDYYPEITSISY